MPLKRTNTSIFWVTYNPLLPKKSFNVDSDRLFDWIKKGAKPTNTIARLLKGQGVKGMEPFIIEMKDKKKKREEAAAPVAAAKPAEEKPSEEKPADSKPAEEKPAEEKPVA